MNKNKINNTQRKITTITHIGDLLLETDLIDKFWSFIIYNELHSDNPFVNTKKRTASTLFMFIVYKCLTEETFTPILYLNYNQDDWLNLYVEIEMFFSTHKEAIEVNDDFDITSEELNIVLDELFTEINESMDDDESVVLSDVKNLLINEDTGLFYLSIDSVKAQRDIISFGDFFTNDDTKTNVDVDTTITNSLDELVKSYTDSTTNNMIEKEDKPSITNQYPSINLNDYLGDKPKNDSIPSIPSITINNTNREVKKDKSNETDVKHTVLEDNNSLLEIKSMLNLLINSNNSTTNNRSMTNVTYNQTTVDKMHSLLDIVNITKFSKDDLRMIIRLYLQNEVQ